MFFLRFTGQICIGEYQFNKCLSPKDYPPMSNLSSFAVSYRIPFNTHHPHTVLGLLPIGQKPQFQQHPRTDALGPISI